MRPTCKLEWWQNQLDDLCAVRVGMARALRRTAKRYNQTGRRAMGHPDILNVFVPMCDELREMADDLGKLDVILARLKAECKREFGEDGNE